MTGSRVSPFLTFEGRAEEAVELYTSLFPDSEVLDLERSETGGVLARFRVYGQELMAFDSPIPHAHTFTPSLSLFVECASEAEVDAAFARLSEGGQVLMPLGEYPFARRFTWLNDRFGVSWQLRWR